MVRKLALAVSLALGSLPLSVYGIGLGDIKAYSALNQNFRAEIQLLSVPRGELDSIRVKLASKEIFSKVGTEYSFVLSRLKFQPQRRRDGSVVIHVSSQEVIQEPFLDFLLEVNWPNGRLIKEYTVLLDPPLTTRRRPARVSSAAQTGRSQTRPAGTEAGRYPALTGDEYGPVAANETMWEIAAGLKPRGVSIHQMMMALLQANPTAFIDGNINLLKKGATLRVPDVGEVEALSPQQAVSTFNRQQDDWMARASEPADASAAAESSATQETGESSTQAEEDAKLQIAATRPDEDKADAGAGDSGADKTVNEELKHDLIIARENQETSRQETRELQIKVRDMETRVEDMKRLLTLKDEQLAQLQSGVAAETDEPVATETDEPVAVEDDVQVTTAVAEGEPGEDSQAAEAVAEVDPVFGDPLQRESAVEAVAEDASYEAEVQAEASAAGDFEPAEAVSVTAEESTAVEVAPEAPAAAPEKPVKAVTKATKQTSWLEDNLTMIGAGAGGLFAVGLLIAFLGRKRKKEALAEDTGSTAAGSSDESILLSTSKDDADEGSQVSLEQDTSFLSEYSTEDLQALQEDTAEVDPIAEADVYIAYGRYEHAQKILATAIAGGDKSSGTRYKMLEIYFATQNKDDFVELAERMVDDGQDQQDTKAWKHIQTMGKELDERNPLFGTAAEGEADVEESELTLDLSRLAEELDSTLIEDELPVEGLESLNLDLSAFSMEDNDEDQKETSKPTEENKVADVIDRESGFAQTELHTEMIDLSQLADLKEQGLGLDDDLDDLSSGLLDMMADSVMMDETLGLDEDALNLADEIPQNEPQQTTTAGYDDITFNEPIDDIEIGAEVDTKLELAKAYMEMGDREGAMSILNEVKEDGTESQVDAASQLIDRLDG